MVKKSAISKKPSNQKVDDFINKGIEDSDKKSSNSNNDTARVQLRLKKEKLAEIDKLLNQRKVKVSRHVWFMEAIEEKLEREMLE
jgi:hypothetical protein